MSYYRQDMTIFFLLMYIPVFILLWFLIKNSMKRILKEKYKTQYAVIGFMFLLPLVFIMLGFLAVAVIPFPAD